MHNTYSMYVCMYITLLMILCLHLPVFLLVLAICAVVKACSEEYPDQVCAHARPGATAPRGTPQRAEARRGTVRKGTCICTAPTYIHTYIRT